jgi:hypothetical protein
MGRIICELERVYGVRHGSNNSKGTNQYIGEPPMADDQKSQSDIAEQLGMSVDALNRYKKLTTLIPEIQDMVQDDKLSPSVASRIITHITFKNHQLTLCTSSISGAQSRTEG